MSHIGAEEFINYFLNNEHSRSGRVSYTSLDEKHQVTFTLQAYILWFNRLSNLICTEIVKNLKRELRVLVLNYFINVANHCFEIGNYNSTMAIIGLINLSSRLMFYLAVKLVKVKLKLASTRSVCHDLAKQYLHIICYKSQFGAFYSLF